MNQLLKIKNKSTFWEKSEVAEHYYHCGRKILDTDISSNIKDELYKLRLINEILSILLGVDDTEQCISNICDKIKHSYELKKQMLKQIARFRKKNDKDSLIREYKNTFFTNSNSLRKLYDFF
jgi:hypothetical protein